MEFNMNTYVGFINKDQGIVSIIVDKKKIYKEIKSEIIENVELQEITTNQEINLENSQMFKDTMGEIIFYLKNRNEFVLDFNGYEIKGKVPQKIDFKINEVKSVGLFLGIASSKPEDFTILGIRNVTKEFKLTTV